MMGVTVTPFRSKCDGRDIICYAWLAPGIIGNVSNKQKLHRQTELLCVCCSLLTRIRDVIETN